MSMTDWHCEITTFTQVKDLRLQQIIDLIN